MLYLLFAVLVLKVSAVYITVMLKINALQPSNTTQPIGAAHQIIKPRYYELNIAPRASRLVYSHIVNSFLSGRKRTSNGEPPIVIKCPVRWQTIKSVLSVLNYPEEEASFDPDIDSLGDIMAVYKTLQICCPKYASRLWEAIITCAQFKDMFSDSATRLKYWIELFCDMPLLEPASVPDHYWSDIIYTACLLKESAAEKMIYKEFIMAKFSKSQEWFDKNASPEIQNELCCFYI